MNEQEVLTIREVASILRVSEETVGRELRRHRLKGIKVGKEWRITRKNLSDYLDGRMA